MATKTDLRDDLIAAQEMCDAAADILTDPTVDDRTARVKAISQLGYRVPPFLAGDDDDADDEEDWDDDEEDDEDWEDED